LRAQSGELHRRSGLIVLCIRRGRGFRASNLRRADRCSYRSWGGGGRERSGNLM
jgi:hypothetical protein